jgi:hypothetical protein
MRISSIRETRALSTPLDMNKLTTLHLFPPFICTNGDETQQRNKIEIKFYDNVERKPDVKVDRSFASFFSFFWKWNMKSKNRKFLRVMLMADDVSLQN